jgi:hypothetical protein
MGTGLAHWDCWGSHVELEHVNKPVPDSTPEAAMAELLEKARWVFGVQDWSAWSWEGREFATGTRAPRVIRFRYEGGAFVRSGAQ